MTRRFRGESVHRVDQKGRVSVPAPFRRVLEEGDPDWTDGLNPNFVLIYGLPGRARLEGYTMTAIGEIDDMIAKLPRFGQARMILERTLNTKSVYAQVDENGRIVLAQRLRAMIGLQDEALFAGMGDRFQIWSPESFATDDGELAAALAELDAANDPFALLDRTLLGDGS